MIEYLLSLGFFTWKENRLGQTAEDVASTNIYPQIPQTLQSFLRSNNYYDRELYAGLSIGADLASSHLNYERFNQDTTCYPDAICFANNSPSPISGYFWFYDFHRNSSQPLEFFTGINLKDQKLRVEFSFTTQRDQPSTKIQWYEI